MARDVERMTLSVIHITVEVVKRARSKMKEETRLLCIFQTGTMAVLGSCAGILLIVDVVITPGEWRLGEIAEYHSGGCGCDQVKLEVQVALIHSELDQMYTLYQQVP